jgi:hypothetical protein
MIRTISLILFALFVLPRASHSQSLPYELVSGPELKDKYSIIQSIGSINDKVVMVKIERSSTYLELADGTPSVVKSVEISGLKYKTRPKEYVDAFVLGDHIYVRFSARSIQEKMAYGVIEEYDGSTLEFLRIVSEEQTKLTGKEQLSVEGDGYWYSKKYTLFPVTYYKDPMARIANYGFAISDNANYMVDYSLPEKNSPPGSGPKIVIRDASFSKILVRDYFTKYDNSSFLFLKIMIDNYGNVHMLGMHYGSEEGAIHHVLTIKKDGSMVDTVVSLPGEVILGILIGSSEEGFISAAGFYGSGRPIGSFFLNINVDSQSVIASDKMEFEPGLIKQGSEEERKELEDRKDKLVGFGSIYDLNNLKENASGGWVFTAERMYRTEQFSATKTVGDSRIPFINSKEILIFRINPQGKIVSHHSIDKTQVTINQYPYMSYKHVSIGDADVFVYNSHEGLDFQKAHIFITTISNTGEMTQEQIFPDNKEYYFSPEYSSDFKDGRLLLYTHLNKDRTLFTLKKK